MEDSGAQGAEIDLSGDLTPEQAAAFLDLTADGGLNDLEGLPQEQEEDGAGESVDAGTDGQPEAETKAEAEAVPPQVASEQAADAVVPQQPQQSEQPPQDDGAKMGDVAAALDMSEDELRGLFGDFSERDLAAGIQKLLRLNVPKMVAAQVAEAMQPFHEHQQKQAADAHFRAIYDAHPDADDVLKGKEFDAWLKAQPSFAQEAARQVLQSGTAAQVVELFSAFKAAHAPKQEGQTPVAAKDKAPATLSDIPAGGRPATSAEDALRDLPPDKLAERFQEMTPEQIERFLNGV